MCTVDRLWCLSTDTLSEIFNLISTDDTYRLWKTGSSLLQSKLRLGVRHLEIGGAPRTILSAWPKFITVFPNLSSLELHHSSSFDPTEIGHRIALEELKLSRLKRLAVEAFSILEPFLELQPSSKHRAPVLKDILPHLKELRVRRLGLSPHSADIWRCLPRSLEILDSICLQVEIPANLLEILPNLHTLKITHPLKLGQRPRFPSSLTILHLHDSSENNISLLESPTGVLDSALNNLHSLKLDKLWDSPDSPLPLHSLPSLRYLDIHMPLDMCEQLQGLPLTSLVLYTMVPPGSEMSDWVSKLPRSLKILHMHPITSKDRHFLLSQVKTEFAYRTLFECLPRQLEDLYIDYDALAKSHPLPWSHETLSALPKSLTKFNFLNQRALDPSISLVSYFPSLREMNFTNHSLPFFTLHTLPATLMSISFESISSHSTSYKTSSIARSLRSLPLLKQVKLNPLAFRLVREENLLPALKLTRKGRLSQITTPLKRMLESILDEHGQRWYYWKDVEAHLDRCSTFTRREIYNRACLQSMCRLDLFLPHRLEMLELCVDSEDGYPEDFDEDQDEDNFDVHFSSHKNDSQKECRILFSGSSTHSSHPHFSALHYVSAWATRGPRFILGNLPDCVSHLRWQPHRFCTAHNLISVLPPKLLILRASLTQLSDADLRKLPRSLTILVLTRAGEIEDATYTLNALNDLPKGLVALQLPPYRLEEPDLVDSLPLRLPERLNFTLPHVKSLKLRQQLESLADKRKKDLSARFLTTTLPWK